MALGSCLCGTLQPALPRTRVWCALKVIVGLPVRVWSWSLPGGHVAGAQCFWVTGGAAAAYRPEEGVQHSSPSPHANPAASTCEPVRDPEGAEPLMPRRRPRQAPRAWSTVPKNPPASGEREAVSVRAGTGEVSPDRRPTSAVTAGIRRRRRPAGCRVRRRRRPEDCRPSRPHHSRRGQGRSFSQVERGGQ